MRGVIKVNYSLSDILLIMFISVLTANFIDTVKFIKDAVKNAKNNREAYLRNKYKEHQ